MDYTLWEWTVRAHSFDDRLRAAVAGGFNSLTLSYREYRKLETLGRTPESLAKDARSAGVTLSSFDGFSGWTPVRYPSDADGFIRDALDNSIDEALELCHRAGLGHIVAIAGFELGRLETSQIADNFGAFWERAAAAGIAIDLEFMPMLGLPTLRHAWDIVRQSGAASAGILFDSWHFMRGDPDLELLRSIPRGRITRLQIVDGTTVPICSSLWEDAMHYRELPGYGQMPLAPILRILRETQDIASIGPEAMSDRLDRLDAETAGQQAGDSMESLAVACGLPSRNKVHDHVERSA